MYNPVRDIIKEGLHVPLPPHLNHYHRGVQGDKQKFTFELLSAKELCVAICERTLP